MDVTRLELSLYTGESSGLQGEWNDIGAGFRFSVAAVSRAGCRSESQRSPTGDRPPLGRRRRARPFFLYAAANADRRGDGSVANDQAANRWELSDPAAAGRVP